MAILDNTYYYFKLRNNVPYEIKVTPIHINTNIMRNYRELTDAQREFYLENPTATVQEVVNCQIYVPPVIEPNVSAHRTMRLRQLKEHFIGSISVSVLEYAMANACLAGTSLTYTGTAFYTDSEARAIMKTFMDESAAAMTSYNSYKTRIEAANTIEDIDEIYEEVFNG